MDDWEYDERPCPACGAGSTRWRRCDAIGCDDGEIDMHEFDDPLWYDSGDTEPCQECSGKGHHWWCSVCGWDSVLGPGALK